MFESIYTLIFKMFDKMPRQSFNYFTPLSLSPALFSTKLRIYMPYVTLSIQVGTLAIPTECVRSEIQV